MAFLIFIFGAIIGSFLGALTWRWPRGKSILDGRSRCPHCKRMILWHDNVPLISYFILKGRCRFCAKPIPKRDFFIELGTAVFFVLFFYLMPAIKTNLSWISPLGSLGLLVVLLMVSALIAVFVIDFEHQYIPDSLALGFYSLVVIMLFITDSRAVFEHLAAGLGSAVFLLSLNLITHGRGMGLGDVKLALFLGTAIGFPLVLVWLFISFVLGSVVGIILIFLGFAKLRQKIAFGPFMVVGFAITSLVGFKIFYEIFWF